MLTPEDLNAIKEALKPQFDELEDSMDTKFEAVHEELEGIKNQMVTKSYLDDKLAYYVKKAF